MSSSNSSKPPEENTPTKRPPEIDQVVDHFLALMCDRSRRQILELLAVPPNNEDSTLPERRSTDIAKELGLSPATTSGHLKQLTEAKLVVSRREGNEVHYRLCNHMLVRAFQDLIAALNNEHAMRLEQLEQEVS